MDNRDTRFLGGSGAAPGSWSWDAGLVGNPVDWREIHMYICSWNLARDVWMILFHFPLFFFILFRSKQYGIFEDPSKYHLVSENERHAWNISPWNSSLQVFKANNYSQLQWSCSVVLLTNHLKQTKFSCRARGSAGLSFPWWIGGEWSIKILAKSSASWILNCFFVKEKLERIHSKKGCVMFCNVFHQGVEPTMAMSRNVPSWNFWSWALLLLLSLWSQK